MIYLDYAAATPVDEEVLNLFYKTTEKYFANPNSSHKLGLESKNIIDEATKSISEYLNVLPQEIIYTSGASESNNLAIKGVCERYKNRGKHILISSLEHNSIISSATAMQEQGFEVELIPIDNTGIIDIKALKTMLRDETILVSITSVDSEIGLKQPIEEIAHIIRNYPNCIFHTDASQAIGKVAIDFGNVDLVTIAPHKFYGLNGIGILIKKSNISLKPQIDGGKSTSIYRSGTSCLALIASTSLALKKAIDNLETRTNYIKKLNEKIIEKLKSYKNIKINSTNYSIPNTINMSLKGVRSLDLQKKLEEQEIYVSTKTSCCPIETPSKLVYALTKDKGLSTSSLRISLSHLTTENEITTFLEVFDSIYKEYQNNGKI